MADDLAATLAEERAILAAAAYAADRRAWRIATQVYGTLKVHALLAVVEKVLELAGDWDTEAARVGERAMAKAGPQARHATLLRAHAFEDCAAALREAITAELTGRAATPDDRL